MSEEYSNGYARGYEAGQESMLKLAEQPAQQEPVAAAAWQQGYDQGVSDERTSEANIGIAGFGAKINPARNNPYTSPPAQRTWVGLTDEELKPLCAENHIVFGAYTVDFIRAIEAKLKGKNT